MNSDIIIRAEGLGKRYQLGQSVDLTRNFREALAAFPRKLARLARHKTQHALDAVRTRADAAAQPALDPETPPGTFWALRDVSFEIKRGEVVGIIGRNGAGKSTLLKVLSRITSPTHGYAEIHGRLASLLEVGTGFHPELTGRENIYLNGAILGMHKAEIARKFDEIVAFAEVEKFLDTPVKRYSSGMYVRLAFAVAAHLESEVLIVDEVLAVGDASFQKKCLGRMGEVAKGGRTILFVSHNLAAVMSLCSHAIYLYQGKVALTGKTDFVAEQYLNDSKGSSQRVPLSDRRDRKGTGQARFVDVNIVSADSRPVRGLFSGGSFLFNFSIHCIKGFTTSKNVVCSMALTDFSGNYQLLVRSNFDGSLFLLDKEILQISCQIDDLSLANGEYQMVLFLSQGDHLILDLIENAGIVVVESGDYFGTGHAGMPNLCRTLTRAKWYQS